MSDVNWGCCPLVAQTPIVRAFIEQLIKERKAQSTIDVKADVLASRLRTDRPGKTNSKEQKLMNADVQTPTELHRERRSQRRWTYRRSANAGGWRAGRSQHRF